MKLNFEKLGHIFSAEKFPGWASSHAANPTPLQISKDVWRVYYSGRDRDNKSHISFVDISVPSFQVLQVASSPVISPGTPGTFDDRGCSVGCVFKVDQTVYMYYLGWNLSPDVPFQNSVGVAISHDNGITFEKKYIGPVLDRSIYDPYSVSYPFIFTRENKHYMIYGSHSQWGGQISDMIHGLKIAVSNDLIEWKKFHEYIIPADKEDYAFSKPYVFEHNDKLLMFYCYRGKEYKIGMAVAEKDNPLKWKREDANLRLARSAEGWDSEMICYPSVVHHESGDYLLYCGNGYGRVGFGAAKITYEY